VNMNEGGANQNNALFLLLRQYKSHNSVSSFPFPFRLLRL
jgi:hypothetical protein